MEQIGRVIKAEEGFATVELERSSACSRCGICYAGETQLIQIELENSLNAQVGQRVLITVAEGSVLKASTTLYLFPLLALVGGIAVGYFAGKIFALPGNPDWWGAGVGIALFLLSFVFIRAGEPARRRDPALAPRMVRIAGKDEDIADLCERIDE